MVGPGVDELRRRLDDLRARPAPHPPDEPLGLIVAEEALAAAAADNYGVGAVLADADGTVVERGHNQVFAPPFRSDQHAEMVVLSRYEDRGDRDRVRELTLVTSLEPCLMCSGRILLSGVGTVRFLALDAWGGMATHLDGLTPAWERLRDRQHVAPADVSDELRAFALDCFELNLDRLRDRIVGDPEA